MKKVDELQLRKIAKTLRYYALRMSTKAGSGHPTSALSAADLLAELFATVFRYDFTNPNHPNNDRLIFSKGHATPLFYGLYALVGAVKKDYLDSYRKITSALEGHPTPRFRYTEAATGSLGQGLSIGVGLALNAKYLDKLSYRTYVLIGDGEMAEGSVWEAIQIASHYKLGNLIGILDVNRLGQSGETMLAYDVKGYKARIASFGWEVTVIDGHDFGEITNAYKRIGKHKDKPYMIVAKTKKGRGISFLEDKPGWHGKTLPKEDFERAAEELGSIDEELIIPVRKPKLTLPKRRTARSKKPMDFRYNQEIPTRKAYGLALVRFGAKYPEVIALDGDVKNSTYSQYFKQAYPDRFFEMFIAEQDMVGAAVGFAKRGKIPFVATFSAFLTRAFDQIRMAAVSKANIKFCGSHAGVSIGADGPSQMGLEDLSMFRSVYGCSVLYPADAVSTDRLVEEMIRVSGISYMRTTRPATKVIYDMYERFHIGGSKVHRPKGDMKEQVRVIVVSAGITLHETLEAQKHLAESGIGITVVDAYSIKPIDASTLLRLGRAVGAVITVEDHWFDGGLGDAVLNVFADEPKVHITKLAVKTMPRSGKPSELLDMVGISKKHIIDAVKRSIKKR